MSYRQKGLYGRCTALRARANNIALCTAAALIHERTGFHALATHREGWLVCYNGLLWCVRSPALSIFKTRPKDTLRRPSLGLQPVMPKQSENATLESAGPEKASKSQNANLEHHKVSRAQFFLNRPLGGGRPVPPTRVKRRRTHFSTLLGIETFPGESRCGAGVEVQLRARHSYFSFMKAWLVSLVSVRGRCLPIGILVLYLGYLFGIVGVIKYTTDVEEETESIFDDISIPVTELGVALFFLLGFRTNNSYQHWRQGRMEWSMIQSRSLNMARECCTYIDDLQMRKKILKWNIALITTMKAHMRETRDVTELQEEGVLTAEEMEELAAEPDMVAACFIKLSECVYTTMQDKLTGQPQLILQMARDNLRQLAENFFLADGIRVTPLPYAYVVHLRFFLVIWLLALPVSYTGKFGWWTVMASFIIGVALLGFDSIATKIENPYGNGFNDIPMDAIVQRSKDIVMYLMRTRTGKKKRGEAAPGE